MKVLKIAAVLAITAAASAVAAPSFAQIAKGEPAGFGAYKARYIYNNLDAREVTRYRAMGFMDETIKMVANLSLHSGVDMDYYFGRIKVGGLSVTQLAAMQNVPLYHLNEDLPGYGANSMQGIPMPPSMTTGGSTVMGTMSGMAKGDITDVAMSNNDLSTLVAAVKAAGLVETLKGPGPFTVFAPTNAAFAKLPAGTVDELLKPENKEKLVAILTYHVIPGKVKAADVMAMSNPSMPKSVQGGTLNVKTTAPVMVNDARVTVTDIEASNGVVHLIDTVLMPPSN